MNHLNVPQIEAAKFLYGTLDIEAYHANDRRREALSAANRHKSLCHCQSARRLRVPQVRGRWLTAR
ncbi:hypothetical protein AGR2A_pb10103 [Agrobacterium genomosp. 2 str. CFBP 5494]|jgi:hypothetical protein|uniref:Uncharacterized protein n=1 Tax=Agrobacterium genomosp. 2 str. CFBP 5494 TaxID=1183436 RepID=A0A9W5F3S5_9HYPH|nr:hypothetical protein RP007_04764 [Rhizobium sp. P007]CDN95433.1 hypothetical protein BN949_04605 [Agrobacterium tumefaciens]CUX03314.1 hypothetical protein AGR2A_pb10103 [Agrobacterium genomosp. 2 str. CFBP 5494]